MRGRSRPATSRGRRTRGCSFGWRASRDHGAGGRRARRAHALDARVAAVLGSAGARPARLDASPRARRVDRARARRRSHRLGTPRGEVCHYTPELAEALYSAYPEADLDGDGVLSRDEACELQAELRRDAAS